MFPEPLIETVDEQDIEDRLTWEAECINERIYDNE